MKITLLKVIGDVGVITNFKPVISEAFLNVSIEGANEGTLIIRDRAYAVKDSHAKIPEYEILAGKSAVVFQTNNKRYTCGTITRNGRFLSLDIEADKLIISCALGLEAQAEKYNNQYELIERINRQFSIDLI